MKILLDTSAYVGFKRNVVDAVETIVNAGLILFSPIILGELMFGFRNYLVTFKSVCILKGMGLFFQESKNWLPDCT